MFKGLMVGIAVTALTGTLFLAGCQTAAERLPDVAIDDSFFIESKKLGYVNDPDKATFNIYLKMTSDNGRLVVCGAWAVTNKKPGYWNTATSQWFDAASVVIGSEEIVSARYLKSIDDNDRIRKASCVITDKLASERYLVTRARVKGGTVKPFY